MSNYVPVFPEPYTSDTLTVYYIDGCPYCNKTRESLQTFTYNNKPLKYVLLNVDEVSNSRNQFWSKINPFLGQTYYPKASASKHNTFPVIFLKGKLIGGNSDLQDILTSLIRN